MWTFQRYHAWLDARKNWYLPGQKPEPADDEEGGAASTPARPQAFPIGSSPTKSEPKHDLAAHAPAAKGAARIDIEPGESEFGKILKRPGE
jgi:hypothetical protein